MAPDRDCQENAPSSSSAILWAGLAGVAASIFWLIGDMLIVGEHARPSDYPLLLVQYAPQIAFAGLPAMLPASEPRLAAGALVAALTSSLYLAGAWHLYRVVLPGGRFWARLVFGLLIFGFANAPLAHAAFYFVGMVYKTILIVPEPAHPALLELGRHFSRVLMIAYVAAIFGIAGGLLLLSVRVGFGRTAWPRWVALIGNPFSLLAIGHFVPLLTPEPLRTWLGGAGISVGTLVLFSLAVWRARPPASPAHRRASAAQSARSG